jgi:hypothetical protein
MGLGEAIRSVDRIAWPRGPGLNNAKPGLGGRHPGSDNPPMAKTPGEALTYIELLYKSGRMEELAKLLRRSQVFRVAWLIVQQSSPDVCQAAAGVTGSAHRRKTREPAGLPVPATLPPSIPLNPEPGPPGPEAGRAEFSPQGPAASMDSAAGTGSFFTRAFQAAAHPLASLLQVYQSQDRFGVQEQQRGQLISIRA